MKFNDKQIKAERMAAVNQIPREILDQPINPNFPEGEKELAALMSFIPEEQRMPMLQALVESLLQQ